MVRLCTLVSMSSQRASRFARLHPHLRTALGVVALYGALSLVSLFVQNPFTQATLQAAELGGWEADQVSLRSGYYGYRFFYSLAEADLRVETEAGEQTVRIRMHNYPLIGWQVSLFDRGPDQ